VGGRGAGGKQKAQIRLRGGGGTTGGEGGRAGGGKQMAQIRLDSGGCGTHRKRGQYSVTDATVI
jgi:hypothetical protein